MNNNRKSNSKQTTTINARTRVTPTDLFTQSDEENNYYCKKGNFSVCIPTCEFSDDWSAVYFLLVGLWQGSGLTYMFALFTRRKRAKM